MLYDKKYHQTTCVSLSSDVNGSGQNQLVIHKKLNNSRGYFFDASKLFSLLSFSFVELTTYSRQQK